VVTNFFFKNYVSRANQKLLDDLNVTAIQMYGEDVYYLPYNLTNYDVVYGASDQKQYVWAIYIEMYLTTPMGFEGDKQFFSKFGPEIRNDVTWSVSMRRFGEEVGSSAVLLRPREEDLIYFPLDKRLFKIVEVSKYENFYETGSLQTWQMRCESFDFSDEVVQTGVWEIDQLQRRYTTNVLDRAILTEAGFPIRDENGRYLTFPDFGDTTDGREADELNSETSQLIQFDVTNPFADTTDTLVSNAYSQPTDSDGYGGV